MGCISLCYVTKPMWFLTMHVPHSLIAEALKRTLQEMVWQNVVLKINAVQNFLYLGIPLVNPAVSNFRSGVSC